jgi:hypothetical protein
MNPYSYLSSARTPEDNAHRQRCKGLPPMQAGEVKHLMAAFLATRSITICPTRYVAATEQGSLPMRREI